MTIRVNLRANEATGEPYNKILRMLAVPREGDGVEIVPGEDAYNVSSVIWTPHEPDYDVQIQLV